MYLYRQDSAGKFVLSQRLTANASAVTGFGASMALAADGSILLGAPYTPAPHLWQRGAPALCVRRMLSMHMLTSSPDAFAVSKGVVFSSLNLKCVLYAAVGQPDAPVDTSAPPYPILSFVAVSNDTVKPGGVLRAPAGLPLSARFGQVQSSISLPAHPLGLPRKPILKGRVAPYVQPWHLVLGRALCMKVRVGGTNEKCLHTRSWKLA